MLLNIVGGAWQHVSVGKETKRCLNKKVRSHFLELRVAGGVYSSAKTDALATQLSLLFK